MSYAGMFAAKRRVGNEMVETRRELAQLKDEVTEQYVFFFVLLKAHTAIYYEERV